MVNARLHIICGNCGCKDYLVHSITERFDDDNEEEDGSGNTTYAALITCNNCSTIHSIEDTIPLKDK